VHQNLPGGCKIISFHVRGDERGSLVALESCRNVPFEIARVYYLFGTRGSVVRGLHAHRRLQQLVVAVSGSCTMLLDDGFSRCRLKLDDPAKGLTLPRMVWHEMSDFSDGCVLLALAEAPYDESDYIRDYGEFQRLLRLAVDV
jgi:dTDP-4-dehydrorhamnose 3,5-epimerase-like enzyme